MTQPSSVAEPLVPAESATPAPAETPPAAETPTPAAPEIDITKGWSSEAYGWSEDEAPAEGAGEQPAATPAPASAAAPEAPAPPSPAEPAKPKLTPEEKKALLEDEEVRADIERRAQSRYSNLLQQQQREEATRAAEAEQWAGIDRNFEQLERLPRAERTQVQQDWMDEVTAARVARRKAQAEVIPEETRTAILNEEIQNWNVAAARQFGATARTLPFYENIPSEARQHLEAGSQKEGDTRDWLTAYMDSVQQGFMAWHKKQLSTHEAAIRNDMRAENGGENPPMLTGASTPSLDPREVIRRHMDYGFDSAPDGIAITETDFTNAKKALGRS